MTKHSKSERAKRAQQNEDVARIEAAWVASVPTAQAKEFNESVAAARARGPLPPPPDMAPGTKPNPPAPGREPKQKKEQTTRSRRYESMTKRKKQFFPPKVNKKGPPPAGTDESYERPNLATINLQAGAGKDGFSVGDKVVISGSGLYSGEQAVIERISAGPIPSAQVRTQSGNSRQVRTIDLSRVAETAGNRPD